MAVQSGTPARAARRQGLIPDRRTALSVAVFVFAIFVLMGLILFLTFLPAQTVTDRVQKQYSESQKLLAGSLARQLETYFNILANDLIDLSRPEPEVTKNRRINNIGAERKGKVKAIVRLDRNGGPRYAYPEAYNTRINNNAPLPWTLTESLAAEIAEGRGVQLVKRTGESGPAYLLVMPINFANGQIELLAIELDLNTYLQFVFKDVDFGTTGQLWVLDSSGSELYQARPEPEFSGGTAQLLNITTTTLFSNYPPNTDRESIAVPISTAFSQTSTGIGSLVLILSRTLGEAQSSARETVSQLLLLALGVIGFVALMAFLVIAFLLREANRRRREEGRRSTAQTLLDLSQTMNSSLDLNIVLARILSNLGAILPHDNASILLFNEDKTGMTIAAESGLYTPDNKRAVLAMDEVGGARRVLDSGKPVLINDTASDPHWKAMQGSNIAAWLGVPLRVRDDAVGVLNINSQRSNSFLGEDTDVAQAFADQAGVAIQNARAYELQAQIYQAELDTARAIQNSLLPQEPPPFSQLETTFRFLPARTVSGDYYQYYTLPDGRLGIAVGDVSGKGIPAALLMAVVSTALRDEILRYPAPAALLKELNKRLLSRMQQNQMNSALLISVFDPDSRQIEIASGGMLSPYKRNGKGWEEIELSGYPIGVAAGSFYNAKTVDLPAGSMLVFMTDGVIEAQNAKRELFGYERFEALLASLPPDVTAEDVADNILDGVRKHLDGQDAQDDITIVVIKSL